MSLAAWTLWRHCGLLAGTYLTTDLSSPFMLVLSCFSCPFHTCLFVLVFLLHAFTMLLKSWCFVRNDDVFKLMIGFSDRWSFDKCQNHHLRGSGCRWFTGFSGWAPTVSSHEIAGLPKGCFCWAMMMVNWWFGARWFGFLRFPKMKGIVTYGILWAPPRIPNHQPKPPINHYSWNNPVIRPAISLAETRHCWGGFFCTFTARSFAKLKGSVWPTSLVGEFYVCPRISAQKSG